MKNLPQNSAELRVPHGTGADSFDPAGAWQAYRAFAALPEVIFLPESAATESHFSGWSDRSNFSPSRWTDAWLAAIATSSRSRLVSFDADFQTFAGLSFLHLKP